MRSVTVIRIKKQTDSAATPSECRLGRIFGARSRASVGLGRTDASPAPLPNVLVRHMKVKFAVVVSSAIALSSAAGAHAVERVDLGAIRVPPATATAETVAPARRQGSISMQGIAWQCAGSRCTAPTSPVATLGAMSFCQALAREVGALRSFQIAGRVFNDQELRRCNPGVPIPTITAPRLSSGSFTVTGTVTR